MQAPALDDSGEQPESVLKASADLLDAASEATAGERPPEYSDIALADHLANRHVFEVRYVAQFGRGYVYDGKVWREDRTLRLFDLSRQACREIAREAMEAANLSDKERKRLGALIASAKTVAAALRLMQADRRIAAVPEQFDSDPWLLNTPAGIVELRRGVLLPHEAEAYCSKITGVAPGASRAHEWHEFLERVTGGDTALQAYLQRLAGYCLTGVTREHSLHFLWGTGANGKSTFLNVLREALGDYASVASADTFTEAHGERHPTDLAALRGARLVIASETEDGKQWAAARIKALTGGDPISARFMRQDFFEFLPQFKLVIAGNHKPGLRNVDEAMRRRMHLIPFIVTIPPEERDPQLMQRLRAELPQILSWAIEGCGEWQRIGLQPPPCVRDATEQYLDDNDVIGAWLAECTRKDFGGFETIAALHASHHAWAEASGERFMGVKKLAAALDARGIQRDRKNSAKGFAGLRIVRAGELLAGDAANDPASHLGHKGAE